MRHTGTGYATSRNVRREAGFNAVNLLQGYPSVRIVSPLELIHENDEDEEV